MGEADRDDRPALRALARLVQEILGRAVVIESDGIVEVALADWHRLTAAAGRCVGGGDNESP